MNTRAIGIAAAMGSAFLWLGSATAGAAGREKIAVGVATFSDRTGRNLAGPAAEHVAETFARLKYFQVLDRSEIEQAMRELGLPDSELLDAKSAVELGRRVGAQAVVTGSVLETLTNVDNGYCRPRGSLINRELKPCQRVRATATLSVRMVKIETGAVMFSRQETGIVERAFFPGYPEQREADVIDEALKQAAYFLHHPVQKAFPLTGAVIEAEGREIWVDLGSDLGVKKGRVIIIRTLESGGARPEAARGRCSEVTAERCKLKVSKKDAEQIREGQSVHAKPEYWLTGPGDWEFGI